MKDAVIALDIGGTSIKGAIINEEGKILYKDNFNIEANFTSEEHKTNISNIIKKLLENMPSEYRAIGIGLDCPGVMNSETFHMGGAENVPGLHGMKFSDIGDLFDLPVRTANDASMAALGEAKYGSGKDKEYKSVMFITLGTGVGGGFVFNGKLFTGSLGGAGEVGHVFVVPDGDKCNCGSSGCIERYASATGFIAMAKQKIHKNVIPTTLTYEELERDKAKAIFDAAKKGDILAKETIAECSYYLGMSIAQALNMLDLDLVLIGGGLCKDFDMMIEHIKRAVNNYGLRMMVRNLEIKPASLGNDAGVLGCAAMFFKN
ncbi:ROK family protein [Brachyspira pilosicoli]|uniref:ROK family protein n=1 Tax=Brachyspira pilosicoli TaxID=52584 RepID=UPI003005F9B8